jgi:hypothetical protein
MYVAASGLQLCLADCHVKLFMPVDTDMCMGVPYMVDPSGQTANQASLDSDCLHMSYVRINPHVIAKSTRSCRFNQ